MPITQIAIASQTPSEEII